MPDLWAQFLGPLPPHFVLHSHHQTMPAVQRRSSGKQETDDTAHRPPTSPFSRATRLARLNKKAQWGFIVPETRRTSQKKSSKSWVNVCYFYPLNLFPPKSWENTPASFTWPRKNDSWKTSFLLGWPIFRGYVSSRGGYPIIFKIKAKVLEGKNRFPEPTFFQWNTHKLNLRIIFPFGTCGNISEIPSPFGGGRIEWIGPFRGVYWFANLRKKIHGFFRERRGIVW